MRILCVTSLLTLVLGCNRSSPNLKDVLPVEVQRIWTLKQTTNLAPEQAPELVRALGLRRALQARYEGNGVINLQVFEMNADASAFELIQKWRQQDGLAVYKGTYFLVAKAGGADREMTASFLQVLRETLR